MVKRTSMKRRSKFRRRLFVPEWKQRMTMQQWLRTGSPIKYSAEDLAWINMPPVGSEWGNPEWLAAEKQYSETSSLPPPPGYTSWLDYAVQNLDARDLNLESLRDESIWGREVSRDEFMEAAQRELSQLRALADKGRQCA
jgi:hypothetical protein